MDKLQILKQFCKYHNINFKKVIKLDCLQLVGLNDQLFHCNIKIYLVGDKNDLPKDYINHITIILKGENHEIYVKGFKYITTHVEMFLSNIFILRHLFIPSNSICSSSKMELLREAEYQLECLQKSIKALKK